MAGLNTRGGAAVSEADRYSGDDPRWGVTTVDCRRCGKICLVSVPAGAREARPGTLTEFVSVALNRQPRLVCVQRRAVRRPAGSDAFYCLACCRELPRVPADAPGDAA